MGFGDFGNWSVRDYAMNKMVFDEAHKKGGGSGNTGCRVFVVVIIVTA